MTGKKTLIPLLGAALAVALTGCGGDDESPFLAENAESQPAEGDSDTTQQGAGNREDPQPSSEYCDLAEEFGNDLLTDAQFDARWRATEIIDSFRAIAHAAPDDAVANDWNAMADVIEEVADLDMSYPGDLENALFELSINEADRFGDIEAVPARLNAHLENGCTFSESQTGDADLGAEPANEYCDQVRPLSHNLVSDVEEVRQPNGVHLGTYLASMFLDIAATAPDDAIAEDWTNLAGRVGSMAGRMHTDSVPDEFQALENDEEFGPIIERLKRHIDTECG
ncbi:hypothetical protein [Phytoactinopolyspora halotolerans]|uniref:Lipoprotein n=1 Tax=Phytoactinopolyspora halotolerans TaxID=1981512 RepID=A0A6L9S3V9_9ACTN|nr:hypothetical protein [Phytoactinopolyspora halotolerans]NED99716.1 hypothetical protein [Phytoactinopolyspora halotolerans]